MGKWYEDAVFYSIYSFGFFNAPFNNDYVEFNNRLGEMDKWVSHIKKIGCDTIYFTPIFKSKSHGYDTTDYFEVDNRLGSNEDFKNLVEKLHSENIKVVLDGVFNHCSRDFFAFKDLQQEKQNSKYIDWFRNVDFNNSTPYNDGFSYDTWAGYYELVKFNLSNNEVREHIFSAIKYWVEYFEIDGLRIDAADVMDIDFLQALRKQTESLKEDFFLVGEIVHGDYSKWANENTLHSVTNYEVFKGVYSSHNENNLFEIAYTLKREFSETEGLYKQVPMLNFVDNHDQNRLASLVTKNAFLYTSYILLFTIPGVPCLYYGSEFGIKGEKANGSDSDIRPYIDIETLTPPEKSLPEVISKLSNIRKNSKAIKYGTFNEVQINYQKPYVFERVFEDETVVVVINISDKEEYINVNTHNCDFYDVLNDEVVNAGDMANLKVYPNWGRVLVKR